MPRFILMLAGLLVMLPLVLGGCKSEPEKLAEPQSGNDVTFEDVKQEASEAADTAGQFAMQQKAEYEKELEARLKDMEARLAELKAEADKKGEKFMKEHEQEMDGLQKRVDAMKLRLDELKSRSAEAWELLKKQFENDADEFDRELEKEKKLIDI